MMNRTLPTRVLCLVSTALFLVAASAARPAAAPGADGWVSLFDGKTLDGWKASDQPGTFRVEDGAIVVNGPTSHLFYVGPVNNHQFTNFEWKAEVMTFPKANSGMYFDTEFQETGWPQKGYEVQVNNSHTDPIRTGSLYGVVNVLERNVPDNEWFTQDITVQGKHIVVKINDRVVVDYTEPADPLRAANQAGRHIAPGTFALQGHDPGSKVLYRNIMVRVLP